MESAKAAGVTVCITLANGQVVIGRIYEMSDENIVITKPYILNELGNQLSLRRYNLFAAEGNDEVDFNPMAIVSIYPCSEKVDGFYHMYIEARNAPIVFEDRTDYRNDAEEVEVEQGTEVVPRTGAQILSMKTRKRIDIESIRKGIMRAPSEDDEEDR